MDEYSVLSKALHHLALGRSFRIAEASFDVEWASQRKETASSLDGMHLFIAGLARAGTTILMRSLYETGAFCSLTYRDMPFVLAPNLWAKITNCYRKEMDAEQRAHGDGIMVDFDSPEALEEVFWRVFTGGNYIQNDCLLPTKVNGEVIEKFRHYISLIMKKYGRRRYLSKNNNNLLRIGTIREAFPNAKILIPFRDPRQQALSLLKQHRLFCKQHVKNPFSKSYMTWLVHHEFGGDHRPFVWGAELSKPYIPEKLEYWLAQWTGVYSHLLEDYKDDENIIFVGYESLCEDTVKVWTHLRSCINIPIGSFPRLTQRKSDSDIPDINDADLLRKAKDVFENLNEVSRFS